MNSFKRILSAILTVSVVVALAFVWFNRRELQDWYALRDYTPPTEVVQLADTTTMTDEARSIFYVNSPLIVDEAQFNSACKPESTIVLGCYISRDGIYIFDIQDERLAGVKQVTAAHELLHAVYERLSYDEKDRVNSLTEEALSTVTDQRILDTIEEYRKNDASVIPNELHSIMATEVKDLPADLETYYKQYFTDRQVVVAYSEGYELEFSARRQAVEQLDNRLAQLKLRIDGDQNELALQYSALKASKDELDTLLNSGQTSEYNSKVPAFNQQVSSYNASVREVESNIIEYNSLVQERNAIAVEVQQLIESIDSRPQSF